jgi:hypothetical protein
MYGFQPSTPADRLFPLAGATPDATDRLTSIVEIRDVVKQLLILSKQRMVVRQHDRHLTLTLVILYTFLLVAYTFAHKNANT